jgi:hypothetical protein
MSDIRETYKLWLEKLAEKKRKKEFKDRLKHGKPQGRTRPPMRMMTNDPGPS